jgi:hypothetical protein
LFCAQYIIVPLSSTDADDSCERVRAVHDYTLWTLLDPRAAAIARGLAWAVMPQIISEREAAIVASMNCTGRSWRPRA